MTRLEIFRAITNVTAGDANHLHLHLAEIRVTLRRLLDELPEVSPLLIPLDEAVREGSHGQLVRNCLFIHELWRGK